MSETDTLRGELFDGVSAAALPVTVTLSASGVLSIRGASGERRVALADCSIAPAVGGTPRIIGLPDGASIETRDLELLAFWEASRGRARAARFVAVLESRWCHVLAAAGVLVAATLAAWAWGIPAAARAIAFGLPADVNALIGERAQPTVESLLGLLPSELPPERQERLRTAFAAVVAEAGSADFEYQLQFRRSPAIGPNAIALPSGTILLTDELVELAERDEELLAVLAHEVTHVEQRHGVRSVLQDSGVAFLAGVLLGDLSSATSLGASLPTVFARAGYSRDFEREADRGAASFCRGRGWGTGPLRVMLERLGQAHPGSDEASWLASHPDIGERVRALED